MSDFSVLADEARARDLGVTVEKHAGTLTNRAAGAERFVDAVGRSNFGLNYQPMFSLAAAEIEAEARALAPLSNNMHIQAVPERGGDDRCLLEDAFFDVEGLLAIFDAAGFDGYANVEFVTDDYGYERAIERDLAYLQSRSG